jgi:hypothetical protein
LWRWGLIKRGRKFGERLGLDDKDLGFELWQLGRVSEGKQILARANGQRHVQRDGED